MSKTSGRFYSTRKSRIFGRVITYSRDTSHNSSTNTNRRSRDFSIFLTFAWLVVFFSVFVVVVMVRLLVIVFV